MRIARVLHTRSQAPIIALERDGALYDVEVLESLLGGRYPKETFERSGDFRTRVLSLNCDGLLKLDERLAAGDRPSSARMAEGSFIWLPPVAGDAFAYVRAALDPDTTRQSHPHAAFDCWLGNSRGIRAHDTEISFPKETLEHRVDVGLAALLGEELVDAQPDEALRAFIGFTIACDWIGLQQGMRHTRQFEARLATQVGPILSVGEIPPEFAPQAIVKSDSTVASHRKADRPVLTLAKIASRVSTRMHLHPGDVIALSCWGETPIAVTHASASVERLGIVRARLTK